MTKHDYAEALGQINQVQANFAIAIAAMAVGALIIAWRII